MLYKLVIFVGILNTMILSAKLGESETKFAQYSKDLQINLKVLPNQQVSPPYSTLNSESRNITGTYTFKSQFRTGVLAVRLLPDGKIKFFLNATYSPPGNPGGTNTSEVSEVVPLKGSTAVYSTQECKISMKFLSKKVVVKQEGSCGFGLNVFANGTYVRRSTQTPQLDDL